MTERTNQGQIPKAVDEVIEKCSGFGDTDNEYKEKDSIVTFWSNGQVTCSINELTKKPCKTCPTQW